MAEPTKNITKVIGNENNPARLESGQVVINKVATEKNIDRLIEINDSNGKPKVTTDGTDGGIFKGKDHYDKNGKPLGGIPASIDGEKTVEAEGGEFLVNKESAKENWKELSKINQSAGGGVPITEPYILKDGGIIEVNNLKNNENGEPNEEFIKRTITYITRSTETTRKEQPINTNKLKDLQAKYACEFAIKNNVWFDNFEILGTPISGGGNENTLYYNETNGNIIKTNNLFNHGFSVLDFIKYIAYHNLIFKNTPYTFIGFGGFLNQDTPYVEPIISQKYIIGNKATIHEIDSYMTASNFEKTTDFTYKNNEYIISDLRPRNVLKDSKGNIYVIDNIIKKIEVPITESDILKDGGKVGLDCKIYSAEEVWAIATKGGSEASSMAIGGGIENESIKGITEVTYEDNGDTLLYGQKNLKTRISVKNSSKKDIEDELNWEKKMLEKQKADLPNMIKANDNVQNSLTSLLKEKDDSRKLLNMATKNIEILEKIVIPFYQSKVSMHQTETVYTYAQLLRPLATGTYQKENFIRFVQDDRYNHGGYLEYSKPLSIEQIEKYEFAPISETWKYNGIKVYYNDKNIANITVVENNPNANRIYKNIPSIHLEYLNETGTKVDEEKISTLNFMKKIESGRFEIVKDNEDKNYKLEIIETQSFLVDGQIQIKEIYQSENDICTLQILYSKDTKDLFQIAGIFVKDNYRKNGYGSKLIDFAKKRALDLGFDKILYIIADYEGKEYTNLVSFAKKNDFNFIDNSNKKMSYNLKTNKINEPKEKSFKERINVEKTAENFKDIRQSLDEFFTPKWTAQIMFDLAIKHGFKGGSILEPSFGHGVFFDVALENSSKTELGVKEENLYGFEIYKPNFDFVKKAHPKAKIFDHNFEYQFITQDIFYRKNKIEKLIDFKNKQFDLVLGNPPYGKHTSPHAFYFPPKMQIRYEGFFIWLALQKVKQGGLVVFIINSLWLQNGNLYNYQKEQIEKLGDLIDAYRLPNKTFKDTDIATDIIVFRKK